MAGIFWDFWNDRLFAKKTITALILGIGMAATTGAGAEIMKGDLGKVTQSQWLRFGLAVMAGTFGGGLAAGGRGDGLKTDELALLRQQIAALKVRRASSQSGVIPKAG